LPTATPTATPTLSPTSVRSVCFSNVYGPEHVFPFRFKDFKDLGTGTGICVDKKGTEVDLWVIFSVDTSCSSKSTEGTSTVGQQDIGKVCWSNAIEPPYSGFNCFQGLSHLSSQSACCADDGVRMTVYFQPAYPVGSCSVSNLRGGFAGKHSL